MSQMITRWLLLRNMYGFPIHMTLIDLHNCNPPSRLTKTCLSFEMRSVSWLLMTWRRDEPGHQGAWYSPGRPGILELLRLWGEILTIASNFGEHIYTVAAELIQCDVEIFNSPWPDDSIWWHRTGSTLAQVMACCLLAPSHYLSQCWLLISKVQ